MSESLPDYLKSRATRSFRYLLREAGSVSAQDALHFASPDWPPQKFGIGQNGSIAGIVFHVAAWKQLTLPLFETGGTALPMDAFDDSVMPKPDDWPGILVWLQEIGARWNARLAELPDAAFGETRNWSGHTIILAEYVAEMVEHDIQHAAQIEYLKQRLLVEHDREAKKIAANG